MELRQLRQALVLAETLNFTRAAERLHMAQPPLSTSIRKLEEELGVTLFERLPTGLKITHEGEAVLRQARRALFFVEEVRRAARAGEAGEQGLLRIGFTGSATYVLMPNLIRAFRAAYPRVELMIDEATTSELLRRLEQQTLDVALVAFPVMEPTTCDIAPLVEGRMMLAVGPESRLAARTEVTLAEIADQPFIIHSRTLAPNMHTMTMDAFRTAGVQPRIVQEAAQVHTILRLVESGMGVGLVADFVARYAGGGVKLLPVTDAATQLRMGLALAMLPEACTAIARNFAALAHSMYPERTGA
ncbi:Ben and cat operon transcriptional regulator [Variovorax sp. SRS16]|uniref:LysR family transcriptional regulator n=1 Tax=Variovorax sp. SRS16 TaxID=282217 RepID=UPI00131966D2|nr:LysR family transcriptional regulator [Variovorax sp. SRS16]VTU26143.1 Ben and cat operon transcriptional regulator [Variovorax sp. SRS16]